MIYPLGIAWCTRESLFQSGKRRKQASIYFPMLKALPDTQVRAMNRDLRAVSYHTSEAVHPERSFMQRGYDSLR